MMKKKLLFASVKRPPGGWCAFGLLPVAAFLLGAFSPFERHQWLTLGLFVPLALVLRRAKPVSGMLSGMLFGLVAWAAGTWWLQHAMGSMMHFPPWKAFGAAMLAWMYQSLAFAVFGLVCGWMNGRGRRAGPVFCASLLTLLVFLRPTLCPVSCVVSVALWPDFIQAADLGGEYLVFFLLLLLNWLLADALVAFRRGKGQSGFFHAASFVVLLSAVMGYGAWRIGEYGGQAASSANRALTIVSVQPDVPVLWGTEDAPLSGFATAEELCLRSLSAHMDSAKGAGLMVFPELPGLECRSSEFVAGGLMAALLRLNIPALLPSDEYAYAAESKQVTTGTGQERMIRSRRILARYNSVFVLRPGKKQELTLAYRKVRLAPFNEATPLRSVFPALQNVLGNRLEVTEGEGPRLISIRGLAIQPLICFETGCSGLVRQGVSMGAAVLVEVSNDGWFASRDAEMKHLGMGIFRTVEYRRPLVRCSNSGSGAFVRPSGELVDNTLTPHGRSYVTSAKVPPSGTTTCYFVWGNGWLWAAVIIVLWRLGEAVVRKNNR